MQSLGSTPLCIILARRTDVRPLRESGNCEFRESSSPDNSRLWRSRIAGLDALEWGSPSNRVFRSLRARRTVRRRWNWFLEPSLWPKLASATAPWRRRRDQISAPLMPSLPLTLIRSTFAIFPVFNDLTKNVKVRQPKTVSKCSVDLDVPDICLAGRSVSVYGGQTQDGKCCLEYFAAPTHPSAAPSSLS